MRNLFFISLLFCLTNVFAQAPEGVKYQALVRDISGDPLITQNVTFRFSILAGGAYGILIYQERHNVYTDQYGMVSLIIGNGSEVNGSFRDINWKGSSHFLKVELDINGGTNYVDMGTSQLLSVPYALFAKNSGDGFSGDYNDLRNKPVTDGSETRILPGYNMEIRGQGTHEDPYIITSAFSGDYNDLENKPVTDGSETKIIAGDNLFLEGAGTSSEPYVINTKKRYIGEHYGGGIVFHVYDNGMHGLIAAPSDQNPEIEWFNGTSRYTNTTGDGIRAGEMNTFLIIALQTNDNPVGNFAAKVCADFSIVVDGVKYGDWYLPSKYELELMYQQKDKIGGFRNKYYWSSTEFSSISAWCQHFSTGLQYNLNKNLPYAVRAIRAF